MTGGDDAPWLGRLVANRYRLIARLGESQVAEVYLARHVLIDRLSAIKFLRTDVGRDRGLRALFLREAKAVNRINHPNIVEITDYGETEETAYLVMEYVPGESLARTLARGPLGWRGAAHVGLRLALALSRAHEMGVVHRDLKPSNVLVVPQRGGHDVVKLTDFGVAKLVTGAAPPTAGATALLATQLSAEYVAPELHERGALDSRSDLFSLGVIVYECATGSLPYGAETPASAASLPPHPTVAHGTGAPRAFDEAVLRLLALSPEERPRDAFEVAAMFRDVLSPPEEPAEQDPPTLRHDRRRPPAPRLLTIPFDRIVVLIQRAWADVYAAAQHDVRPGLRDDLVHLAELVRMVERLGATVGEDTRALGAAEERGRVVRTEFGARLDDLAQQRSQALGWAGSLAEESDKLRTQRQSGAHLVSTVDRMLWEEATLEHGEELTRARAAQMAEEIEALQAQLRLANEALERDRSVLEAQLAGHVAALRALASETWAALDAVADTLDVELQGP